MKPSLRPLSDGTVATGATKLRSALCVFVLAAMLLMLARSADAAQLVQDHPWQVTLRNWMSTLNEKDFQIEPVRFEMKVDYAKAGDDELFRAWTGLAGAAVAKSAKPTSLLYPAKAFTLQAIEGGEAVRLWHESEEAAWWVAFDVPENPYKGLRAAKLRAVVMAAVNMIMFDTVYEGKDFKRTPDQLAENLHSWAFTCLHAGDVLPPEVRQAYLAGVMRQFERMVKSAPRGINSNMDTREIIVLALMEDVLKDDPAQRRQMVTEARRILFGDPARGPADSSGKKAIFHSAGYIAEANGPETSYNGISLYHLMEAAVLTRGRPEWDAFMPEVISRMLQFKAHQTYPEPDGTWVGPSSWAKRTPDDYPSDQRARPWRELSAAALSDHGLYLLRLARPEGVKGTLATRDELRANIDKSLRVLNMPSGKRDIAGEPPVFSKSIYDWPSDLVYFWDGYVAGSHARFEKLVQAGSPLLQPPFGRDGDINRSFNGEFWIAKQGNWGFQVESVPDMGWGYDEGGAGALAGGSLACFWTRETGSVILGRLPDKWNNVTWAKIENWTTHHLWGRSTSGKPFSSARQWKPTVEYDNRDIPRQVVVKGTLNDARSAPDGALQGKVEYRRTFRMEEKGLAVSTELTSDRKDRVKELWESLPVFLRHSQRQGSLPDTVIEFQVDGAWRAASAEPSAGVTAVRLGRFGHAALIAFDSPRRVCLSAEPFQVAFQAPVRLRMIKVDLLGGAPAPTALPEKLSVTYTIRAAP